MEEQALHLVQQQKILKLQREVQICHQLLSLDKPNSIVSLEFDHMRYLKFNFRATTPTNPKGNSYHYFFGSDSTFDVLDHVVTIRASYEYCHGPNRSQIKFSWTNNTLDACHHDIATMEKLKFHFDLPAFMSKKYKEEIFGFIDSLEIKLS